MSRKRIVILGGGTGGTLIANRLRRRFDADEAEIHVVDRDGRHVYQPGLLFVPFGLTGIEEIVRPRRRQLRNGIVFHEAEDRLRGRSSASWVAYVPAHQGYVVMTLCRALYALATGKQATKEEAATWAAARYPEWSRFISETHATYRADVRDSHHALISFTDYAVAQADDPKR